MSPPTNANVAALLDQYATMLQLAGESPFRARAYTRVAEEVRSLPEPVASLVAEGRLRNLPGVGPALADAITDIVGTGRLPQLDQLAEHVPVGLVSVLDLPGIGIKTAMRLHAELGVVDLDSLESAVADGRVRSTKGMGERLERTISEGLDALRRRTGRHSIGVAVPLARQLAATLAVRLPGTVVEASGSVRRLEETVGGIDLLVGCRDVAATIAAARGLPLLANASEELPAFRFMLDAGIPVSLRFVPIKRFGTELVVATGSREHVTRLGALPDEATEEAVYARLGLPWIPPELRQGDAEFRRQAEIPGLVTVERIVGEYHCHTTWSDGGASVAEMAAAAADRGYRALAITDHSHSLGVANGLTTERLRAQRLEIEAANRTSGVHLLQGSEVEVDRAGNLDFPDDVLAWLDVVVASTHSGLRQPREQLTSRLLRVIGNRNVDIIAHPSGRLIERRDPGDFDWPRVYAAAAEHGTALEINADPARLDLDPTHAAAALAAGCLLTINCDAHAPTGFASMEYGIAVARRAWAPAGRVINTWPVDDVLEWLRSRGA